MVTVQLFRTNSDPNVVNKELTSVAMLSCDFLDSSSTTAPVVLVDLPERYHDINYMYIPDFNRYFYAKTEIVNGSLCRITGKCDVLMSFKSGILATKALLDRSADENLSNLYFADEKIRKYSYERTQTKYFPLSPFNRDGFCVLITAGGAPLQTNE